MLKVEELSRRKMTEDFEEVSSFFQGSNVKTVYNLGDNDAKYPDAEIDDERTRNSLASSLCLQEREASASLLQVYHSQKRKLVSTVHSQFLASTGKPVTGCHNKRKSNQEFDNCQIRIIFGKRKRTIARRSKIRDPETWIQSGSCRKQYLWIEETNWFSRSEHWAYSNRVWTVQTSTSSTSRRIGRSRTSTSWYSY